MGRGAFLVRAIRGYFQAHISAFGEQSYRGQGVFIGRTCKIAGQAKSSCNYIEISHRYLQIGAVEIKNRT